MNMQKLLNSLFQEDFDGCLRALGLTDSEISEINNRRKFGIPRAQDQPYIDYFLYDKDEPISITEGLDTFDDNPVIPSSYIRSGDMNEAYKKAEQTGLPCIYNIYTLKSHMDKEFILVILAVLPGGRLIKWTVPVTIKDPETYKVYPRGH